MKNKNIISLSVAFAFLALSITGILLYIKQKSHAAEITHTIFGLTFVGFAIFHIINNWASITGYSKERKSSSWQKEFKIAGIGFLLLLAGGVTEVLEPIAEAGRIFAPKREKPQNLSFTKIETNKEANGQALSLMVQLDKETKMPVIAIWTEDETGKFGENLFVPTKIAFEKEPNKPDEIEFKDFDKNTLPTFAKNGSDSKPNFNNETPKDNFILKTISKFKTPFNINFEIKSGEKTELFKSKIDTTAFGIYKFTGNDGALINKIIIEKL